MKFHQKFQIINKVFILLLLLMVFGYFYYANELVKAEKLRLEIQESKFSKFRDVYDGYHYSKYNEYWKKMTRQDILKLRSEWQEFVADVKPRENVLLNKTRGIVYTCHDGIAKLAIVSILMLRKRGCELPIEVWHYGNELGQKEIEALLALKGVMVKDLALVSNNMISKPSADDKMFEAKGAALINSEFDEILFLDSDNVAVVDPTFLFNSPAFVETGAIFWKDFWKTRPDNPIYEILDLEFRDEFEQESGQLVIDKSRPQVWKALNLAFYLQRQKDVYFKLLNGDKDTFNYAWKALNVSFHMVEPHVALAGVGTDRICGHTMVQMVPLNITKESIPIDQKWDQQVLFMHTNTLKYYPDEVRFGSRAFELFQHTPYLRADDAYLTIFYIDGRFCIEFAEYQSNGIEYKAVMSNFTTILPDFKQEYQLLINQAEHLY